MTRTSRKRAAYTIAAIAATSVVLAACSSSGGSGNNGGGNQTNPAAASGSAVTGKTIKIGLLADKTGPAGSEFATVEKGIKAYVDYVNNNGGVNGNKLEWVEADTTSTAPGTLTAAQKLVQSDKVFAILDEATSFFGAEQYLLKAGIPVVGTGFDGPEWEQKSNTNLFAAEGVQNNSAVYTTTGLVMKQLGVTRCGTIGFADNPDSAQSAEAELKSCEAVGLQGPYIAKVPFSSTDTDTLALAMKSKNVDGVSVTTDPVTGFSVAASLYKEGVKPKAFLLPTGYGGDLLASKDAVQAAQGFEFSSQGEPVEMNTAATQQEVKNLAAEGVTTSPTFAEQNAYISMAALVAGLKAAGPNPTQQSFMSALRGITDFDADGLLAPEKVNFSDFAPQQSCSWFVKLEGDKFVPLPNLPICGTLVK